MNHTITKLPNGDFEVMQWDKLPKVTDYDSPVLDSANEAIEAYKRDLVEWLESEYSDVLSSTESKMDLATMDIIINHIKGE